jgi:hypothetical protein
MNMNTMKSSAVVERPPTAPGTNGKTAPVVAPAEQEESTIYASPTVAAAFIAGLVYIWLEAIYRLLFTYTSMTSWYMLWNGRVGDIGAMWLGMAVISLAVFFILRWALKGRKHVGTIVLWTVLIVISALVAPFVGEIGQSFGI